MIVHVPYDLTISRVIAPPSKSFAQRAILAATLGKEKSTVLNAGTSDDVLHIIQIAKQLGASVQLHHDVLEIKGQVNPVEHELNCGESGLGVRLTTSIAAALGDGFVISGKGSLLNRPMGQFEAFLPKLGVLVRTNDGKLPLRLSGQLKGGNISIDGSLSSQFLSGLLMALPLCEQDSVIEVNNLKSIPYIDMTLETLWAFGIGISTDYNTFTIPGNQRYQPRDFIVEGDWSGAAFWVVYGAIKNHVEIGGLNPESSQADRAILKAIEQAGARVQWKEKQLSVIPNKMKPFSFDATDCPDLFPCLVVLAAAIEGNSIIKGINRLTHKESNRGKMLQEEFRKLGLRIDLEHDDMIIHGKGKLHPGTIHAHSDHRIAMAAAIAATLTDSEVTIENAEAVNKSYPGFWNVVKL